MRHHNKNKKGFADLPVLVFGIIVAVAGGIIFVAILMAQSTLGMRNLEASSYQTELSVQWNMYLSLPSDDPRGLRIVEALEKKDLSTITAIVSHFATTYVQAEEWRYEVQGVLDMGEGSCWFCEKAETYNYLPMSDKQTFAGRLTIWYEAE
jgi:hypothetical protein